MPILLQWVVIAGLALVMVRAMLEPLNQNDFERNPGDW
jgi:hypothetical protein